MAEDKKEEKIYDMVIMGAGPAGLTAAIYAARAGITPLVLDPNPMSGGQVLDTDTVDNYPGLPGIHGMELGMSFRKHADRFGIPFSTEKVLSLDLADGLKILHTDKGMIRTRTLIIASGGKHRPLQVPGEERLKGAGVSYCATCDGGFFRKKPVAVVGGGDTALEDALYLSRTSSKVYLIHRRDQFRGQEILQKEAEKTENIEPVLNSKVTEIRGDEKVSDLVLQNTKTGETTLLPVKGIFVAVGTIPDTDWLPTEIKRDEKGYILAGEDCETSVKGVYAAGDIRTKALRQVITAAADGANAATSAGKYLQSLV